VKFKMSENSLFALLLRSPWWISFVLVAAVALASRALLPAEYVVFGALGAFPIFVVGCIAAWRQLRAPSAAKVQQKLESVQAMPWNAFSQALTHAWVGQGFDVNVASKGAVDLRLVKDGQTILVSAKRWKAATHGIEPLRELYNAVQSQGAQGAIYVAGQGSVSESAALFARDHGITLLQGPALAALLLG
jgi:restriction system protein